MVSVPDQRLPVGRINGLFGVRGWVRVFSYTEPRDAILSFSPWLVRTDHDWRSLKVVAGRRHGAGVVAQLQGYDDRDRAAALMGAEIAILRQQLPPPAADEFYWADLIGLQVVNSDGLELGAVADLLRTGANDVLVVRGDHERLIPFVRGVYVTAIDLDGRRLQVDWDPED